MERVLGIGGFFVRAEDPDALTAWYRDVLGIDMAAYGVWTQESGPTVVAAFPADTDYFGARAQQVMLNFRVADLDAMLAQLAQNGSHRIGEIQEMDGVGRFAWINDPAGNRLELWQPA
ncbi:VOC family protein [Nocardioides jejuensis]|uniref:VOC family protein n=1 Tax=Nocardioides jejuensis TaxID=2502782 RepID=A0A4R1BZ48_9ACTN|nr:VOC family protein [Nocardioides jejuensis]TCJ23394.1 VOC family protein [Nocardioides jejuensis]